jgi:hypothetical protein
MPHLVLTEAAYLVGSRGGLTAEAAFIAGGTLGEDVQFLTERRDLVVIPVGGIL